MKKNPDFKEDHISYVIQCYSVLLYTSIQGHNGYSKKVDSWYLKDVEIDVPTQGKVYNFPCNRWLGNDKEDGLTKRILTASDGDKVSYKPRRCLFKFHHCQIVVSFDWGLKE